MDAVVTEAMKDSGKRLLEKADAVLEVWIVEARQRIRDSSVDEAMFVALQRCVPQIIEAIAAELTQASATAQTGLTFPARSIERAESGVGFANAPVLNVNGIDITLLLPLNFDAAKMQPIFSALRTSLISTLLPELSAKDTHDVVGVLRAVDNVMDAVSAYAIEQHAGQIEASQKNLVQQDLLSCNQELLRLVQMQKDNASHMAHELKNPLHAIISFSSILLRRKEQKQGTHPAIDLEIKQLSRIVGNAQHLSRLVTNMLEVSRQESVQQTLNVEAVELVGLMEDVVDSLDIEIDSKGLVLTQDYDHAPSAVYTDSLRLQQIVANLVSNAVRYTDEGTIGIRCYAINNREWVLAVTDTGRGISTDQQSKIFTPYFRVGKASEQIAESSGLGLTIVSKLVGLLGGTISLESVLGEGSTFEVTLPVDIRN